MSDDKVHTNLLSGRIRWNDPADGVRAEEHRLSRGIMDVYADRIPGYAGNGRFLYYDDRAGLACAMIGYFANLNELRREYGCSDTDDLRLAAELFRHRGTEFIHRLEGVFSLFLWEEQNEKGYLFQDEYGSNTPLYYVVSDGFYFSTSLKGLLSRIRRERRLNQAAVAAFLYDRRIVPNEMTLVEGVCKMVPGQYLTVDGRGRSFRVCPLHRHGDKPSKRSAEQNLIPCIEARVKNLFETVTAQRWACALSGGFDSTLLLNTLARYAEPARITAVSIGGREINEIPQAQRTLGFQPGVAHLYGVVPANALDDLPDMVWRLEGYVFEEGMLLQYGLARMLAANGLSLIFLGEGADQQLDRYRFAPWKRWETTLKGRLRRTPAVDLYYRYCKRKPVRPSCEARLRHRFGRRGTAVLADPILDVILKKNGLMLHSFGIQGLYPFLSRELRTLCEALGRRNRGKKFYKSEIARILGANRTNHLIKIGGQTDIGYVMRERLPLLLRCLETDVVRETLTTKEAGEVKRRPEDHHGLLLQLVYLHLFQELFLSGKFDARFAEPSLEVPLAAVLNDAGRAGDGRVPQAAADRVTLARAPAGGTIRPSGAAQSSEHADRACSGRPTGG